MSESRVEILAWISELLCMNITKIEQLGTGAAICQVFDSIYHDVPLSKVKFDAKHEYEYVQNFKVLQNVFDKHKIANHIPVERLIKLKFQDNIEFIQFVKKFWDSNYPGGHYDAVSRRKGVPFSSKILPREQPKLKDRPIVKSSTVSKPLVPSSSSTGKTIKSFSPAKSAMKSTGSAMDIEKYISQITELKATVEGLEKERDFYFSKLRDIEILTQNSQEKGQEVVPIKEIFGVLYATEEGFETPEGEVAEEATLMVT